MPAVCRMWCTKRRGRRFPVRSGDADQFAFQKPIRQFDLAPDRDALRARFRQKRIIGRHARARNDQVLRQERFSPCARRIPASLPASRNFAGASPSSLSGRESVAVTIALCLAQNSAVATPVRASPTASTRIFRNSIDPGISLTAQSFPAQALTAISASSAQTAQTPAPQSRTARSLCSRSSPATQNGGGSAPCGKSACRAI